ncbi:MAG: glutamine-hydrolyzing carbamoyl-phosphate synthase small subunit, partial [bacterium]
LYLREHGVAGITGVDTRALTRHIRSSGAMRGIISASPDIEALIERVRESPGMEGRDLVREVTIEDYYTWEEGSPAPFGVREERGAGGEGTLEHPMRVVPEGEDPLPEGPFRVAVLDYGVKQNILRRLVDVGSRVRVYPADTPASHVMADAPHGVVLSNGPGDPAALPGIVAEARTMAERVPCLGICLGHQVLGRAFGYATYKLKFGHHGANHPVKRLATGRVEITSQNHGFAVDLESGGEGLEETHVNLNDGTNEGFRHTELPVFAVQYHPEASPGPKDAAYLFREFVRAMGLRAEETARTRKEGP